jgi:4-amino-4-deoxy-L-arabinose transferase
MIFYESDTQWGLILSSIPAVLGAYFYFIRDRKNLGLFLLMTTAVLIRLLMISLDPYVQEWDERFHALVAKNMIESPFRPVLYPKHIMAYNMENWADTHVWVHKQPLFLWQMALSMKIFGINTFALRLPSALLGAVMVWMTFDIGRKWTNNHTVGFIAAFLSTFAYYALELIAGWRSLEHNDLIFVVYMTFTFWAFTRYVASGYALKWAIWIGIFAGFAILNKWLTGFLIYGGWGLYILQSTYRSDIKKYAHIALSVLIACIVFIPWQIYILKEFPEATAIAYKHNRMHMTGDLGHPGTVFYHLAFLPVAYHFVLLAFFLIGCISIFRSKVADNKMTISFMAMMVVLFAFFSLLVATKMPAFVYPVSAFILILSAYGFYIALTFILDRLPVQDLPRKQIFFWMVLLMGYFSLKPHMIMDQRAETNVYRNNKIQNSRIFKSLDDEMLSERVILNTRSYENIELMFYKDVLAYHWYPTNQVLDSLQALGHKFAAFNYKEDPQSLPDYIVNDPEVLILKEKLR